jgi:zinc protease
VAARRLELRDPRAGQLSMQRYYLAPSYKTAQPGEAEALDLLVTILGDGPTSRLYSQLVEEKNVAANAGASYSSVSLDSGTLNVYAVANDGVKQEALEQAIDAALAQFIKDGPTADELELAKSSLIASYIYGADNQASLAQRYGSNLVIGRTIADVEEWPDRLERVTAEDVRKAAARHLDLKASVTGFLIPQAAAGEAAASEKRQ